MNNLHRYSYSILDNIIRLCIINSNPKVQPQPFPPVTFFRREFPTSNLLFISAKGLHPILTLCRNDYIPGSCSEL